MKNVTLLLIGVIAMTLSSCGTFAAYSEAGGQMFEDGVYSSAPSLKELRAADAAQRTRPYPGNRIKAEDLTLNVTYYNYRVFPWGYRGWYGPWHYGHNFWHIDFYDPLYYGYNPWYYYCNPWYYSYDPWYYGCSPWYHKPIYHRPPFGGHYPIAGGHSDRGIYRGSRLNTTSGGVSASTNRSNSSTATSPRSTVTTSRSSFGTSRTESARSTSERSYHSSPSGSSFSRGSSGSSFGGSISRSGGGYSRSSAGGRR